MRSVTILSVTSTRTICRLRISLLRLLFLPVLSSRAVAAEAGDKAIVRSDPVCGFYLHACWDYSYPFAVRKWQAKDYDAMFRLLHRIGYNTVMLWPVTEAIPAPLSKADTKELRTFRKTIAAAQQTGLRCWLARTPNLLCKPELAQSPWMERNFFPNQVVVRLDDPQTRDQYFRHREAISAILNNADAYVTIDGDPGGYAGAPAGGGAESLAQVAAAMQKSGAAVAPVFASPFPG